jgi:Cu(I)/Ag(I) efflux system membrane fusion protein
MSTTRNPLRVLRKTPVLLLLTFAVAFFLGRGFGGCDGPSEGPPHGHAEHEHGEAEEATIWTCSMHPQIQLPDPGQCPICFMDLIPVEAGAAGGDRDTPRLELSESARVMAEIETVPVVRDRPFVEVRLVGKVDFDETRTRAITAWVPGRLDRLFVDYTGISVRKGDHLAEIYSPELLSTQEELLQALRSKEDMNDSGSEIMRASGDATVEAAREKLRLLGLTSAQIDRLVTSGSASDHVTVFAHMSGVVVEKTAVEGDYVNTGTAIYRIADLDNLWVKLDAYESDLAWLRYGQEVEFTTEAVPGRIFRGEVVFISPTLDPRTRTSKVRVHVDNREGLLKPEMFVHATILAEVGSEGRVVTESLAGKWICPMHPEVVRDTRGSCDVCGMDLERAEDLGHVNPVSAGEGPLVIPRSAVLFTGKRAVVYVEDPDADGPAYEGREVVLGPRAGDLYLVKEGLSEGERVVVKGNFKIDSALQIQAKPSMMSPGRGSAPTDDSGGVRLGASEAFIAALSPLYEAYFGLASALAADDVSAARESRRAIHTALHAPSEDGLSARGRQKWSRITKELMAALNETGKDADIAALRTSFERVSKSVIETERLFGHARGTTFYLTFCPMAFDFKGAYWMQDHEQIDNPFFGKKMLRCGEVREEFAPVGGES